MQIIRATEEGRIASNEASRRSSAKRKAEDPVAWMLRIARREPECDLTREDLEPLLVPMECAWSGLPLRLDPTRTRDPLSPSLERIDNTLGHVRGNVAIVAQFIQYARNAYPLEEFLAVLDALRAPRKEDHREHQG